MDASDDRCLADVHLASREVWDTNAEFWDDRMGEGNDFHRVLVGPAAERLLAIQPGERVLDVACGNGQFSRRLAEFGADVVGGDFSPTMVEIARSKTAARPEIAGHVGYRVLDATDEAQLLALGEGTFDAAVCNMALMDISDIGPLMRAMPRLLRPDGRFVFTVQHPCFNHPGIRFTLEEEDQAGELVETRALKVVTYLGLAPAKGLAIIGQPVPQWYFNRPLHVYLAPAFAAGLVLDVLEEPGFPPGSAEASRPFSWVNFSEIPPVLAARLRPRR
jgi:SAM-dependent methyltransferase